MDHRTGVNKAVHLLSLPRVAASEGDAGLLDGSEGRRNQGHGNRNEIKDFYASVKAVYGLPTKGIAPLVSSDETTFLTEKKEILKRWTVHFKSAPNSLSAIPDSAIDQLSQVEPNKDIDLALSFPETIRGMHELFSEKAQRSDRILAEGYKHRGPWLMAQVKARGRALQGFKNMTVYGIK
ncbi:hypothetical protein SprV_0100438100 [Sparganum proliferum]